MPSRLKILAIAAALAAGASSAAMAQSYGGYACPAGYVYAGGACQPAGYGYAPSNPVLGAAAGGAAGAAAGGAAGGPVGAVVGGAIGTATGAVTGAATIRRRQAARPDIIGPMARATRLGSAIATTLSSR